MKTLNILLIIVAMSLAACGGGGGGGGNTGPSVTVPSALASSPTYTQDTPSVNTISWPAVSGASTYKVIRNSTVIATDLTSTSYTDIPNTGQGGTYQVQACNSAGCSESSDAVVTSANAIVSVATVTLSNSNVGMLTPGSGYQLTASVAPVNASDKTVKWSSSNSAVATVDRSLGVVSPVSAGTAQITAASANGNIRATATVYVSSTTVRLSAIRIATTPLTLVQGASQLLTVAILPVNATNENVNWSSDNPAVATVNGLGIVTGVSAGTANIRVVAQDSGASASLMVTVTPAPTYSIGGSITNLTQVGLSLTLTSNVMNTAETIAVPANSTSFQFATQLPMGSTYSVMPMYQPPYQNCTVSQHGTRVQGAVSDVRVACSSQTFVISGSITGLTAPNLLLQYYSSGEQLPVNAGATTFAFAQPVPGGTNVAMQVKTQPYWQWCTPDSANYTGILDINIVRDLLRCAPANAYVSTLAGSTPGFLDATTASAAQFNDPTGVVVDSANNVFVADSINNAIRKITPAGVVTTFAGSINGYTGGADGVGTAARFTTPVGLAIDASNNLYVTERYGYRVRKITPDGTVSLYAGSGTAGTRDGGRLDAQFTGSYGIAVDSAGIVYVTDADTNRIRKILPDGTVTTYAGTPATSGSATFTYPMGIAVDAFNVVHVSDTNGFSIKRITPNPTGSATPVTVTTVAGTGTFGFADNANPLSSNFNVPIGIVFDKFHNLFIVEQNSCRIRKIAAGTTAANGNSGTFGAVTTFAGPTGGCVSNTTTDGLAANATFGGPIGLTIDANGNFYVAEIGNDRIRKISPGQ